MAEARRVIPDIDFNGKSAKKSAGRSHGADRIRRRGIRRSERHALHSGLQQRHEILGKGWLPKKGSRITASLAFKNWTKEGAFSDRTEKCHSVKLGKCVCVRIDTATRGVA